ncbi:MAG: peptidoglycan-binding domain-containing protein [Roseococcus sp.]
MPNTAFPGATLRRGSGDAASILAIQQALNARGCGPIEEDGRFGDQTEAGLRLFQLRFPDAQGQALEVDGECGPVTWAAIFGAEVASKLGPAGPLGERALAVAVGELGHMEVPPGSNAGPEVEKYLASVGLGRGLPWCAAFVFWCASRAGPNALPRTGGVEKMWRDGLSVGLPALRPAEAQAEPSRIAPGMIFFITHGGGTGHTGFVEGIAPGGRLITVEGNTNDGGSREGIGVFRLNRRGIASINLGFLSLA